MNRWGEWLACLLQILCCGSFPPGFPGPRGIGRWFVGLFEGIGAVEGFLGELEAAGKDADGIFGQSLLVMKDLGDITFADAQDGDEVAGFELVVLHERVKELDRIKVAEGIVVCVPFFNEERQEAYLIFYPGVAGEYKFFELIAVLVVLGFVGDDFVFQL